MTRAYFVFCFEGAKNVSHSFMTHFKFISEFYLKKHIENKSWISTMTLTVYDAGQI